MKLLHQLNIIINEGSFILDAFGDLVRTGAGILIPPIVLIAIAKNVREIKSGDENLQNAMLNFSSARTEEGLKEIEEGIDEVTTDLLDLASSLIQVIPDPTALSDMGAFAVEQILQYGVTEEVPVLLGKIRPLIGGKSKNGKHYKGIPFVGKTEVGHAMETVGEAHELLVRVEKSFEEYNDRPMV